MSKPRIIMLMPWVFSVESVYGDRLRFLSEFYCGSLYVLSNEWGEEKIGEFHVLKIKGGNNLIRMVFSILADIRKSRVEGNPFSLIMSYDPLKVGIVAALVARICDLKFIVEINGVFTSPYNYVDMENKCIATIKRHLFPAIEGMVIRAADGVKLLYPRQIDYFRLKFTFDKKIVRSFPDYTNVSRFKNLSSANEILFAGYPFYRKGLDVLIDAFKVVSNEFPDWTLKIIGWFPDKKNIENYIGGHPRINLHPPVDYKEMPQHVGSTGILVLPSRSEGMGRVLLEAMACEKPRIGSNIEGIPTVLEHNKDGLLVEPGSVEELVMALRLLMGSPGLRRELGGAGKIRLDREFTEAAYFSKLIDFYNEVLAA